jgi:SPP1 gp7 family putative phage head morphogenesis protein
LVAASRHARHLKTYRPETPVHAAADKHLKPMLKVIHRAIARGRYALGHAGKPNVDGAANTIKLELLHGLRAPLLATLIDGGKAAMGMLKQRRAAEYDEAQHPRDEHGQWTSGDIVYHGSTKDFEKFDTTKVGTSTDEGWLGSGTYFSTDKRVAHYYPLAYETRVTLKNPLKIEIKDFRTDKRDVVREALGLPKTASVSEVTKALIDKGHDGVVLDMSPSGYKATEVMAIHNGSMAISRKYETGNKKMWDEKAFSRPDKYRKLEAFSEVSEKFRTLAGPSFTMRFDAESPDAIAWAEEHAGLLATQISDTTRQRIRDAIVAALEGDGIDAAYADIEDAVGDEARAELIAHTEIMTAANEGQREAWDQAIEAGLLTGNEKKEWIATGDANVCPQCDELDGTVVGLDEQYPDDGGDGPPAHPQCRCTEGIVG